MNVAVSLLLLYWPFSTETVSQTRLLEFSDAASNFWHFKELTFIDLFATEDAISAEIRNTVSQMPQVMVRFISSDSLNETVSELGKGSKAKHEAIFLHYKSEKLMEQIDCSGLYETLTWFVPAEAGLTKLQLRLDSRVYLYAETDAGLELSEAYAVKGGSLKSNQVGNWSSNQGIYIKESNVWERRKNLSDVTIVNAVLIVKPLRSFTAVEKSGVIYSTGYLPEMLDQLSTILNFKVIHVLTPDGRFGTPNPNGSWNGMVGMLNRREADVSATDLAMTYERSRAIVFTTPMFSEQPTLIIKRPTGGGMINVWAYMKIFTINSWVVIFITLFALSVALMIIGKLGFQELHDNKAVFHFLNCIGIVFIALLQRDNHTKCENNSSKLMVFVICMFCFLSFTYFATFLTSYMTVLEPAPVITSFHDVLKYDYDVNTFRGSLQDSILRQAKPPSVFYYIYTRNMRDRPSAFLDSLDDVVSDVLQKPKTANFGSAENAYMDPGLVALNLPDAPVLYVGIGLQPNSEFEKMFNYFFLKMKQSGVMIKIYQKWFNASSIARMNSNDAVNDTIVLDYDNLIFPCFILLCGTVLSLCCALLEVLVKYCCWPLKPFTQK